MSLEEKEETAEAAAPAAPAPAPAATTEGKVLVHFYNTGGEGEPYHVGTRFLTFKECKDNDITVDTRELRQLIYGDARVMKKATYKALQDIYQYREPARLDQGISIVGQGNVWLFCDFDMTESDSE